MIDMEESSTEHTGENWPDTTPSPGSCKDNGIVYNDSETISTDNPCKLCTCNTGNIECTDSICPFPKNYENCTPLPTEEAKCCSNKFECGK